MIVTKRIRKASKRFRTFPPVLLGKLLTSCSLIWLRDNQSFTHCGRRHIASGRYVLDTSHIYADILIIPRRVLWATNTRPADVRRKAGARPAKRTCLLPSSTSMMLLSCSEPNEKVKTCPIDNPSDTKQTTMRSTFMTIFNPTEKDIEEHATSCLLKTSRS